MKTKYIKSASGLYLDEQWEMPKKVDRKKEVEELRKILIKKEIPLYVHQFGVGKHKKSR